MKWLIELHEQHKQFNSLSGRGSYGGGYSIGRGSAYGSGFGGGSQYKKFMMNKKWYGRLKNESTKYSGISKKGGRMMDRRGTVGRCG